MEFPVVRYDLVLFDFLDERPTTGNFDSTSDETGFSNLVRAAGGDGRSVLPSDSFISAQKLSIKSAGD